MQKLRNRYKFEINKEELKYNKMAEANLVVLGGPRTPFTGQELKEIRQYIEAGGSVLVMMNEGGESKAQTNINAMLEQFGIFVNTDCVIRKAF